MALSGLDSTPVTERIVWLDVLRGAALFGIAQINFPSFAAGDVPTTAALYPARPGALLESFSFALTLFISAKFYPVFAFLFGYGHALQRQRFRTRGRDHRALLRRRYLTLLAFGVLHGTLLFFGDILTLYACAGLALLILFEQAGTSAPLQVLRWGICAALISLLYATSQLDQPAAPHRVWVAQHGADLAQLAHGDGFGLFLARAHSYVLIQLVEVLSFLPTLLFFMCAGIWACEQGVWQHPERHRPLFRSCLMLGLGLGIPVNLALAFFELKTVREQGASVALTGLLADAAFVLSLAYLGGVGLYAAGRRGQPPPKALLWLAAMGRLALTNYLTQSVLMTVGWYLGWRVLDFPDAPLTLAALALLVCLLQGVWSQWYLRRRSRGPFEALWRRLTYAGMAGS